MDEDRGEIESSLFSPSALRSHLFISDSGLANPSFVPLTLCSRPFASASNLANPFSSLSSRLVSRSRSSAFYLRSSNSISSLFLPSIFHSHSLASCSSPGNFFSLLLALRFGLTSSFIPSRFFLNSLVCFFVQSPQLSLAIALSLTLQLEKKIYFTSTKR